MNFIDKMFSLASSVAKLKHKGEQRNFVLGAVGLRSDDVIVGSRNIISYGKIKECHAEARLARKLDKNSIVFVVRLQKNGDYCMAKPCKNCENILRAHGVRKVYYTITNDEYGVINL